MPVPVEHNSGSSRFEASVDGEQALLGYRREDGRVVMTHVTVPPPIEGRGVAGELTRAALDWARGEALVVEPQCPYVAGWIRRHPEYADLLAAPGGGA
jgi:uncharacterized protein